MKTYKVILHKEFETEAENEDEAIRKFWNDEVEDIQSDAESFIDQNLDVEEISKEVEE